MFRGEALAECGLGGSEMNELDGKCGGIGTPRWASSSPEEDDDSSTVCPLSS